MAWFIIQSLLTIVLAFVLGLIVGWLWWRRRKVHFSQSDAVTSVTSRHEAALAAKQTELDGTAVALKEKDIEIGRLSGLVTDDAAELAARHDALVAAKDAEIAELTGRLEARDADLAAKDAELDRLSAATAPVVVEEPVVDEPVAVVEPEPVVEPVAVVEPEPVAVVEPVVEEPVVEAKPVVEEPEEVAALVTPVEEPAAEEAEAGLTPAATGTIDLTQIEEPAPEPVAEVAATEPEPQPQPAPEPVAEAAPEPVAVVAPADVVETPAEPDELERVEGIGPRIGAALRQAGIVTFRQLADADTATLQGALEKAGLRFAPSLPTWSRQAALLADGNEEGFVQLTESLVGGRDVSRTKR